MIVGVVKGCGDDEFEGGFHRRVIYKIAFHVWVFLYLAIVLTNFFISDLFVFGVFIPGHLFLTILFLGIVSLTLLSLTFHAKLGYNI